MGGSGMGTTRSVFDALVIGSGPAGLIVAAALGQQGLRVQGLTPTPLRAPWPNTYGIWRDELELLGLEHLLGNSWSNCVSYFEQAEVKHDRTYGLFDKTKLQDHFLAQCESTEMVWHQGHAATIVHQADHSCVTTTAGTELVARVVIDASGHQPVFVERIVGSPIAFQAAYGIVGKFSAPPVEPGQFVLMDYRSEHLTDADKAAYPPTFVYATDLGNDVFFVEETSLSAAPPVPFDVLERRLHQRLKSRGIEVTAVHEVERCLFPMNLPMPRFDQSVVGFGGAASMVHPATGYTIGAMLRRAPGMAAAIATALKPVTTSPESIAAVAWQALWPDDRLKKYDLYQFGLEKLMRFDETLLKHFFETFFSLPKAQWSGFLSDSLTTPALVRAMLQLFGKAPNDVRWGLMQFVGREPALLWRFLTR
jgi:lycopene beta-cyclase